MTLQSRPESPSTQPLRFGKYVLLDRINVGGMAEVFKAKAFGVEGFEKIVAIKRILPTMSEDAEFIKMFVDEARITVQLHHENIVQVHELGRESGQYYIAMEYVSGRDMRQVLDSMKERKLRIPVSTAAYIASCVAEGLDYAHHKSDNTGKNLNLIHRDVSPQNILVSYDGAVKITDFGIAKAEDRASKTQAGVLKGKFAYMSPEQVRGQPIDGRSDIFAVGILLYEMVTGERLFLGESDFSTLDKVRKAEVRPPSELNSDLPAALEAIILKALAREPGDRFGRGAELAEALEQFLIEDSTIFSAKRMRTFMEEHFSDERDRELSRMRSLPPTPPPPQPSVSGGPPPPPLPTDVAALGGESEKTVIFAGGMEFGGEKTELFDASKLGLFDLPSVSPLPNGDRSNDATVMFEPKELERVVVETGVTQASPVRPSPSTVTRGLQLFAAVIAVLLLGVGISTIMGSNTAALRVNVTPSTGFKMVLDGRQVGEESPVILPDVQVGEHRLSVSADGYLAEEYGFEVVEGRENQINITLRADEASFKNGVLVVVTDPANAEVIIDGGEPLRSPLTQGALDRRVEHVIQIAADGFLPQTRRFRFKENESETLQVKLEKVLLKAKLNVRSEPSGAIVMLDGEPLGKTPIELSELSQSEAARLSVLLAGYEPYNEVLLLRGGKSVTVNAKLKEIATQKPKAKGSCSGDAAKWSVMTVNIPDCRVRIGRTEMGVAPFFKKNGPSGRCEIKVECLDGRSKTFRKKAQNGSHTRIIVQPDDWN